jgi:hypothetical protein
LLTKGLDGIENRFPVITLHYVVTVAEHRVCDLIGRREIRCATYDIIAVNDFEACFASLKDASADQYFLSDVSVGVEPVLPLNLSLLDSAHYPPPKKD